MTELPSGTVTLLFTDIEGSTRLWEEHRRRVPVRVRWSSTVERWISNWAAKALVGTPAR